MCLVLCIEDGDPTIHSRIGGCFFWKHFSREMGNHGGCRHHEIITVVRVVIFYGL
jgi:hypothetical protein